MFRIIKAGAGIGLTENLNYIKKAENGCYILCPEHDASGIVFEGVAYHLLGRAAMDELETVSLEQTDAGSEITKATEAGGIVFVTLAEAGSIDAETAAEHADLFAEWAFPVGYTVGQIRRYNGTLYKCVQAHTSQADWTPDTASSLWSKTSDPAEEWPEWSQPVGAHDAYSKGAKVSHKEKHWISMVDSNVCGNPVCTGGRKARMEYKTYVCRKRARFKAICGQVNIPYGTTLNGQGGFLILNDLPVCSATSQNAYDFFTQNDDGMGQERGELLNRIIPKLEKRDAGYQARWGKIWEDALCQKYKRPDQEEHWIWNFDFYNGPVEDLRYIAALIGA